jgi:hypothetical protein
LINKDEIFINKKQWKEFDAQQMQELQNKVFQYYRENGFPYYPQDKIFRDKEFNKLNKYNCDLVLKDNKLQQTMHGLGLAWSYFPHSWSVQCNNLRTPMQSFEDDIIFKKVIEKRTKMGDNISDSGIRKMLRIVSGTQAVSNFRPTSAAALYNHFAPNGVVWDMSAGFGGRLLGFIVSKAKCYFGTDPSTKTYDGLMEIKQDYGTEKFIELVKKGSENFIPAENSLDFCFTSPPYFDCEKYSNEPTQSYVKFNTKDNWRDGFLRKTFENCYYGLKKDKYMLINIANTKTYPTLEADTIQVAMNVGFTYEGKMEYLLSNLSLRQNKDEYNYKAEPVFMFRKK